MLRCTRPYLFIVLAALSLAGCDPGLGADQHGEAVTAQSLEGQWLVVNYWAPWCGPCRREIPQLNTFAAESAKEGVQVLGVDFDQPPSAELAQAAEGMGIAYRVLAQDPAAVFKLPRPAGLPVTFILDPQRNLKATLLGEQTAEGLRVQLAALKGQ